MPKSPGFILGTELKIEDGAETTKVGIYKDNLGTPEAELLKCYPPLRAIDLANAWYFYNSHKDEIDKQIQDHEGA